LMMNASEDETSIPTKLCYKCSISKPITEFSKDRSKSDGLTNRCKACRSLVKGRKYAKFIYIYEKICTMCGVLKNRSEFRRTCYSPDGLNSNCTKCKKQVEQTWYSKNKDIVCYKVKLATKRNKVACRRYVIQYLTNHPCVDCGETDLMVLDFDHIIPADKLYSISRLLSGTTNISLKRLKVEIEKCAVRCANCHRKRTAKQFGSWKFKYIELIAKMDLT